MRQLDLVGVYAAVLLGLMAAMQFTSDEAETHYYGLADAFLAGKAYVAEARPDLALFNGRYYYPDGPLFSVILIPFAAIEWHVDLAIFGLSINLGVFYACFYLARRLGYGRNDAVWFAVAFVFGTSFVGSLLPWDFSHRLVVLWLFAAIIEYVDERRFVLIGLLVGLAMASRASAGMNIMFFSFAILLSGSSWIDRVARLAKLLLPFVIIASILALYNYTRFGDPVETGYGYQLNASMTLLNEWTTPGNIAGPTMSILNVPTNLKVFLFGLPDKAGIGSSVFLVSPFLVYLWWVKWDRVNKLIALNCAIVLLIVLSFRSTGLQQIGYRFSLDFLPFVFWIWMRSEVTMTVALKTLIFAATVIDLALVGYFLS